MASIKIEDGLVYIDSVLSGTLESVSANWGEAINTELVAIIKTDIIKKIMKLAGEKISEVIHPYSLEESITWKPKLADAKKLLTAVANGETELLEIAPDLVEEAVHRNDLPETATDQQKIDVTIALANLIVKNVSKSKVVNRIIGRRGFHTEKVSQFNTVEELQNYNYKVNW